MLTFVLIAATMLVSWLAFENPKLQQRLILWPPAIERRHQYDRLLTHGFIHADWPHLLFNMLTLYFFGRNIEVAMNVLAGPAVFVFFYLSAIVVAILPSYLRHRRDANYSSLGASGGVSAVLFASILLQPWTFIYIPIPIPAIVYAVGYVAYSFWMDKRGGDGINHSAHLSGAIYGVLFMLLMDPRVAPYFLQQLSNPPFR
ncbi:rhomboid family intramembrane serine protease [Lysobacter sp. cf310]|uniref:rhomboid family intramembrane serine protease n=1 Tax=Lysobacter sp. cf310 TaxID=1761790 RepID=UPI0008E999A7|nr:rhomboid family intramembrane serine protease [Lysobacter sp. cf310]SFK66746.1 Membrane associated serine protease, rhomboid family [Lysobacter sp. cf310]